MDRFGHENPSRARTKMERHSVPDALLGHRLYLDVWGPAANAGAGAELRGRFGAGQARRARHDIAHRQSEVRRPLDLVLRMSSRNEDGVTTYSPRPRAARASPTGCPRPSPPTGIQRVGGEVLNPKAQAIPTVS